MTDPIDRHDTKGYIERFFDGKHIDTSQGVVGEGSIDDIIFKIFQGKINNKKVNGFKIFHVSLGEGFINYIMYMKKYIMWLLVSRLGSMTKL